jgi:release factor glutamine methyltransferase
MAVLDVEPGTSVAAARRAIAHAFAAEGLDTPELDARVLVGHALGLDHAALVAAADRSLDAGQVRALSEFAARRLAREPVARIVGTKEFWGLSLHLGAATLVPRPETETVVEAALAALDRDGPRTRALRLADLGTGSGALLLALLSELPNAVGIGTDVSFAAVAIARDNAARLGFGDRARFVVCDFGVTLAGDFDLVVSNPPYVRSAELAALAPEVRHDPVVALDGGSDGLASYRAIAAEAKRLLAPDGHLVVELGGASAADVARIFTAARLAVAGPPRRDLAGIPRALRIRTHSNEAESDSHGETRSVNA